MKHFIFNALYTAFYSFAVPQFVRWDPLNTVTLAMWRRVPRRRMMLRGLPNPVHIEGLVIYHDDRPSFTIRGLAHGTYETETIEEIQRTITPGMNVIDLGAHVGYFTLNAARLVGPHGHVWAFEPDPSNRESLEQNITANGFEAIVSVVPFATGSKSGAAQFYADHSDSGSSTLFDAGRSVGAEEVQVTTLDDWARDSSWPAVHLIKMDIEGAELSTLEGMREFKQRNPGIVLIVELNCDSLARAGVDDPMVFLARLSELGFRRLSLVGAKKPITSDADARRLIRIARWKPINIVCQ